MSRRIAIVEDDPEIGPMLSKLLKMEGFEATVINDGRLAARAVSSGSYSAVVLDVMLPGKDGITILRELRTEATTKRLPVVMLSAKTDEQTTWDGWRAGASYFLPKPFDPEELVRVLRTAMG
jgi:two-component system OmpR family response regulator